MVMGYQISEYEDWIECWQCNGKGIYGHECGQDCICTAPEDNEICDVCEGNGGWNDTE